MFDFSGYLKDGGIVGGIIMIFQVIKFLDKKQKFQKGFYILGVLFSGFLCGFIVTPYTAPFIQWLQASIGAGIVYAGASSLLYQTGKLVLVKDETVQHKFIDTGK